MCHNKNRKISLDCFPGVQLEQKSVPFKLFLIPNTVCMFKINCLGSRTHRGVQFQFPGLIRGRVRRQRLVPQVLRAVVRRQVRLEFPLADISRPEEELAEEAQ